MRSMFFAARVAISYNDKEEFRDRDLFVCLCVRKTPERFCGKSKLKNKDTALGLELVWKRSSLFSSLCSEVVCVCRCVYTTPGTYKRKRGAWLRSRIHSYNPAWRVPSSSTFCTHRTRSIKTNRRKTRCIPRFHALFLREERER